MITHVINPQDVNAIDSTSGGSKRFGAILRKIGARLGLQGIGCRDFEVAPGKRAFPYHNTLCTDEIFVILEGERTYQIGVDEHAVKAGDICGVRRDGRGNAHQLVNTSETILKFLAISTHRSPDIVKYPGSGKFFALHRAPGEDLARASFKFIGGAAVQ